MPISPYTGSVLYTGFTPGNPYTRSATSSKISGSDLGYPYKLTGSNSSSAVKSTPFGTAPFLTGNTAALKKTFSDAFVPGVGRNKDKISPSSKYGVSSAYNGDKSVRNSYLDDIKEVYSSRPNKYEGGLYASRYSNLLMAKGNADREKTLRLKEIDASKINVSGKPPRPTGTANDLKRFNNNDSISRNRQVVRLTIKREKEKALLPIYDSSVKTIAQKLIEKYTVHDKKKEEHVPYVPKSNRWLTPSSTRVESPAVERPPKSPERSTNVLTEISAQRKFPEVNGSKSKNHSVLDDGDEGDDELSSDDESSSSSSDESDSDTRDSSSTWLSRANRAASLTRELRNKKEMKDAILAAALNPGVDLESDEEIKQLVDDDSDASKSSSKRHRKSPDKKHLQVDKDYLVKRKKSEAEIGGEIIVDKLKRFVKQQVSIKKQSLKKRSIKASPKKQVIEKVDDKYRDIKPDKKERIIPIILQDDDDDDSQHETNDKTGLGDKDYWKMVGKSGDEESQKESSSEMQIAKVSSLLNEREKTIKCAEKSLAKSSEPVYPTSPGMARETLPGAFQTPSLVSGERSITRAENKVPAATSSPPPPLQDPVSAWKEEEEEFLLDSSSAQREAKMALRGMEPAVETAEQIISNFKQRGGGHERRRSSEVGKPDTVLSKRDNSIKEASSNLKEDDRRRISHGTDEAKSNYRLSGEIAVPPAATTSGAARKEFDRIADKCPKKRVPLNEDEQRLGTGKDEGSASSYTEWNDSHVSNSITEFDQEATEGRSLSTPKETANHANSSRTNKLIKSASKTRPKGLSGKETESNSLEGKEVDTRGAKAKLTDGKLLDKNVSNDVNQKRDLQKSATTQLIAENRNFGFETNVCHDAESILDDSDIKPRLRQFLEDSKAEMISLKEKEAANRESLVARKTASPLGKISESVSHDEVPEITKKAIKRPRQINVNTTEAKPEVPPVTDTKVIGQNRKILKRPVKPVVPETKPAEEIKPKRVWKKPVPPLETPKPSNEYLKILNQLKTVKLKNDLEKMKSKEEASKTTTVREAKLKKVSAKEKTNTKSEAQNIASATGAKTPGDETREISIELQSDKEKISDVFDKKSRNEKEPRNKSSDAKPLIKRSKKKSSNTENSRNVIENISFDRKTDSEKVTERISTQNADKEAEKELDRNLSKSALSTSHSADSAYGSSPSTPQPRTAEQLEEKGLKGANKEGDKNERKIEETGEDKCELCGTNCHKKCEKQMANLCGVNQKLLAEALSSVKKGSSADGRGDVCRTLNVAPASKSISSVSSSDGDTTTTTDDEETDTDCSSEYSGPAEIRPPITTRPKYKKYTIDDFNFIKVLGKGSFGKVMLAQQISTENYFAVKCLKKDVVLEDNDVECCLIERKVLTLGTKHPYLCHLFCSFQTPSHLFFVMEYLTGGDLMFHIQHVGRFDEYRACFYAAEITSGLKFLHSKGIIYRDLKLDNILLDYEGHIRIADFGMCKLQIYLDKFADTFCGTPDYMAPEVIKGAHYNQCVDWWSFGVLLYEMMTGKSPFKGCDEDHLFWLICNEEPFYPRFLSREAQSILKQLLDKDSTRRLGPPYSPYGEIKDHQFFKYVDWNKIERKEVETPYKPRLRHILDVQYFDRLFTKRNATLTPLDDSILETMDQTPFKDFSYTNPNITD